MDITDLWFAAELTSKLCRISWLLRTDPLYLKEEAATDLEKVIEDQIGPMYETALHKQGGEAIEK